MSQIVQIQRCQYTPEQIQVLKNTSCKGASDDDFMVYSHICARSGLDPFAKQIYAVMRKNHRTGHMQMTIQTGIDGYRLIADRTGKYSPGKEPTFSYDGNGKLFSATAYIKKQTQDGTWHEVSASAIYSEYVQVFDGAPSQFWAKMPHGQLAKCAEALALRKAFPKEMSGIYVKEEMDQASNEIIASDGQVVDKPKDTPERPRIAIKLISEEQLAEFTDLMSKCSDEVRERVEGYLKGNGVKGYAQMSEMRYSTIIDTLRKDALKEAVA
jgi:phage recombination protein Bet